MTNQQHEEVTILYYLHVLNKWKISISVIVVISASIAALASFSKPRVYTSSVSFLFPSDQNSSSFSSLGGVLGIPNTSTSKRIIMSLVKSRRMAEDISEKFFPAMFNGGARSRERAMRMVGGMVNIYEAGEIVRGVIEVKSNSAQLSADIANFCVINLDAINQKVQITAEARMVKVIDPAIVPVYPDSRNIKKNTIAAILLGFFGGIFIAFCAEYFKKFRQGHKD